MDSLLAPLAAAHAFMGAVAFVRDGKLVHARGAGMADVAAGRPFTPSTPADGGSLAKTLTAAAVWTLAHEGRIVVDTPATAYLPDYPHGGTTVRQLITHTNGLPPYYEAFDPYFGPQDVRTTEALLAAVRRAALPPRFTPGTQFEYSNLGFDAAALIVERISGVPIARVFAERFFTPLGMDASFARPGKLVDFPSPRTLGYRWNDSAWVVADVYDNEAFIGGSNVYFSTLDLARWAAAHATGTALPPAVRALGEPHPTIDGTPSPINGLSWYCDDSGDRCHYGGAINAFHSFVYWDRTRRNAVVMMSNSSLSPWALGTLQRELVAVLDGRPPATASRPAFTSMANSRHGAVVGGYVAAGTDTITVTATADGLRVRVGTGLTLDAFVVAEDVAYVPGLDWFIGFTSGADGSAMHVRSVFQDFVLTRVP